MSETRFTLTNAPLVTVTTTNGGYVSDDDVLEPLFSESVDGEETWYTVVLGRLLADWGEGTSKWDALADLATHLRSVHEVMHNDPDERLAEELRHQRDFLCMVFDDRPRVRPFWSRFRVPQAR